MESKKTILDFAGNDPAMNAYKIIMASKENHPLYLTGHIGTGKASFVRMIAEAKRSQGKKVGIVTMTRAAAEVVQGEIIYEFFEFQKDGITSSGSASLDESIRTLRKEKVLEIQNLDFLIIYEASTIPGAMFEIMDHVLKMVRKRTNPNFGKVPFGNVQVLIVGDHFVYSPFRLENRKGEKVNVRNFFQSEAFEKLNPLYITLQTCYTNIDPELLDVIKKIRKKENSLEMLKVLRKRVNENKEQDVPYKMRLLRSKADVKEANDKFLKQLVVQTKSLNSSRDHKFHKRLKYAIEDPCTQKIEVMRGDYEGGQIMFNSDDPEGKYKDGDIGFNVSIKGYNCKVDLITGERIQVKPVEFEYLEKVGSKKKTTISRTWKCFPFKFCFAITIYRSHRKQYRYIEFESGAKWLPGQLHVALTRCTSLDSLTFSKSLNHSDMVVSSSIYEFDEMIKREEQTIRLQEVLAEIDK
jgi:ATP-dependent DNA helicase PIF1